MVLKEIVFLRKHTRASGQRIFGSFHGANVCLRPVQSPGAENLWLQQIALIDGVGQALCGKVCRSSSLCHLRPHLHRLRLAREKWASETMKTGGLTSLKKSSGKSVINRLLTLKCLLLYTADHHRLAVPPSAPSGTRSQTGQSLRP